MARYTGPKTRISRIFGEPILGNGKYLTKNSNPPGQHGAARKRKTMGEYAVQLKEKQKAKYTYGLLERQFRAYFHKAERAQGGVIEAARGLDVIGADGDVGEHAFLSLELEDHHRPDALARMHQVEPLVDLLQRQPDRHAQVASRSRTCLPSTASAGRGATSRRPASCVRSSGTTPTATPPARVHPG